MKLPLLASIDALNRAAVDYVVVGGLAVIAHGHRRATVDVDVIVRFTPINVQNLVTALQSIGFRPKMAIDPFKLSDAAERKLWQDRNMVALAFFDDKPPWTIIDVFIDHPIDYDQLRAQSVEMTVQGTPVRVCGLKHLIELKRQADRPKDNEDLRWLYAILDQQEASGEA